MKCLEGRAARRTYLLYSILLRLVSLLESSCELTSPLRLRDQLSHDIVQRVSRDPLYEFNLASSSCILMYGCCTSFLVGMLRIAIMSASTMA